MMELSYDKSNKIETALLCFFLFLLLLIYQQAKHR